MYRYDILLIDKCIYLQIYQSVSISKPVLQDMCDLILKSGYKFKRLIQNMEKITILLAKRLRTLRAL